MTGLVETTIATQMMTDGWLQGSGITVDADVPGGTDLRFAFRQAGGQWKYYDGGAWAALPTQDITAASLLAEGSTKAQAESASGMSWMLGSLIDVALAMTTGTGQESPAVRSVGLRGNTGSQHLSKTVTSAPAVLADKAAEILDAQAVSSTAGNGAVNITAALQAEDNSWSDYMPLAGIKNQLAKSVVFRADVSVGAVNGPDSANLASVSLAYRAGGLANFTEGIGRIITLTLDLYNDQGKAHAMVKWHPVKDAGIRAYASFRASPVQVTDEVLGTADGTPQHFALAHPEKVAPHTLAVKFGGLAAGTCSFNSSTGEITVTAAAGTIITASYQYNWEPETWLPMQHAASYPDNKDVLLVNEQFSLSAPQRGPIVALMVEAEQGMGTAEAEALGAASGIEMPYLLAHRPRPDTIKVKANGAALAPGLYHFDEGGQVLYANAPSGEALTADYDWLGEPPEVSAVSAVWNR